MSTNEDDGGGCLFLIAIAFIGFGVGNIWGGAYGFLAAGVALLLLLCVIIGSRR